MNPEHIESDVLVDYQETFNAIPSWKPVFPKEWREPHFGLKRDGFFGREWNDAGEMPVKRPLVFDDWYMMVDQKQWDSAQKAIENDPSWLSPGKETAIPTDKDFALLPRRFFAYAVLERKYIALDIRQLRSADREANDKAFEGLEINKQHKKLILALVKSHFDKIEAESKTNVEIDPQDLIRGKGKGVVILLHGVPGVGKTATAEAVALKWKRPLFPITCGEPGIYG